MMYEPPILTALPLPMARRHDAHIAGAPAKAGAGGALIADHERKACAACAPYFHVLDGTVELQGHP